MVYYMTIVINSYILTNVERKMRIMYPRINGFHI